MVFGPALLDPWTPYCTERGVWQRRTIVESSKGGHTNHPSSRTVCGWSQSHDQRWLTEGVARGAAVRGHRKDGSTQAES